MRKQMFVLIAGTNGTGKTTQIINIAKESRRNNRKTLFVLPDDTEPKLRKAPTVEPLKFLSKHKGNAIAKSLISDPSEFSAWFDHVRKTNRPFGATLIIDDAKAGVLSHRPNEFLDICRRRRQMDLDIFLVFHSPMEIPPSLFSFATHLWAFRTVKGQTSLNRAPHIMDFLEKVNEKAAKNQYYNEFLELNF